MLKVRTRERPLNSVIEEHFYYPYWPSLRTGDPIDYYRRPKHFPIARHRMTLRVHRDRRLEVQRRNRCSQGKASTAHPRTQNHALSTVRPTHVMEELYLVL